MLYEQRRAFCCDCHRKHVDAPCGKKVELLNDKPYGTQSNHCATNV
jgi:hypothetical protein